jgi:hypothetical protein
VRDGGRLILLARRRNDPGMPSWNSTSLTNLHNGQVEIIEPPLSAPNRFGRGLLLPPWNV